MNLLPKPDKAKRIAQVRDIASKVGRKDIDHKALPDIVPRSEQQMIRLENELKRQKVQGLYE